MSDLDSIARGYLRRLRAMIAHARGRTCDDGCRRRAGKARTATAA